MLAPPPAPPSWKPRSLPAPQVPLTFRTLQAAPKLAPMGRVAPGPASVLNKQLPPADAPQAALPQGLPSTHTCWKLPPVFCKCHPSLFPACPQAREPMTPCDRGRDRGPERLRVLPEATQLLQEHWAEARASQSKVPAGHVCPHPSPEQPWDLHHLSWTRALKAAGSEAMRLWASAKPSCTG